MAHALRHRTETAGCGAPACTRERVMAARPRHPRRNRPGSPPRAGPPLFTYRWSGMPVGKRQRSYGSQGNVCHGSEGRAILAWADYPRSPPLPWCPGFPLRGASMVLPWGLWAWREAWRCVAQVFDLIWGSLVAGACNQLKKTQHVGELAQWATKRGELRWAAQP